MIGTLTIKEIPREYNNYQVPQRHIHPEYNATIAEICYRRAIKFISDNQNTDDTYVKQQIAVLEYLLFRFMNNSTRRYISTQEIRTQLQRLGYEKLNNQAFRNKIIASLRDAGVIISSSSHGYKIPSTESELYDFVNHGKSIILPMLSRLKLCNDAIRLGTDGAINLFERAEYHELARLIQSADEND